jgi:Ca-activated chloride channel family protein
VGSDEGGEAPGAEGIISRRDAAAMRAAGRPAAGPADFTASGAAAFSDGEALSGSLKAAVGRCNQQGVAVIAVAAGSDSGGEVPGAEGIISRRDAEVMRAAAGLADFATSGGAATKGGTVTGGGVSGGAFIDGNRRDAAGALAAQLRSLAPESEVPGTRKETKARWLLFTVPAIAALVASKLCLLKFSLRKSPVLFSIILTLFVCGCSGASGKLLIIQANFQNAQGLYSEAITAYLKALEHEEAAPYAEYGMGSVYYTMGEEKAALNRFSRALDLLDTHPSDINRELRYRIHYNTGVVLFGEGDFAGATFSFREALRADGGKVEAKRNLELCIKSYIREQTSGNGNNPDRKESRSESMVILMDYIKQKELNQWRSRTWQEEETAGPDY